MKKESGKVTLTHQESLIVKIHHNLLIMESMEHVMALGYAGKGDTSLMKPMFNRY